MLTALLLSGCGGNSTSAPSSALSPALPASSTPITPAPTPAPTPVPTPAPAPVDPDAGQTLTVPSVTLDSAQPTATLSAPHLSFKDGRTLRLPGLPAGVSYSVDTAARTLTLSSDLGRAVTGTAALSLQYVTAEGKVLLSAPFTLSVKVPVAPAPLPTPPAPTPTPAPVPSPAPIDPDAGQTLSGGSLALSPAQPSAVISAANLSFTAGRTLRVTNLPAGVAVSVDAASKTATLALDAGAARSGTTSLTVQYVDADGTVRLSAAYTLTISLPAPVPADPDAGQTLSGGAVSLSASQPSAAISAPQLSFTSGRTLRVTNLPAGVSATVSAATRSATLSLDPAAAVSGTTTLDVQYVNADGSVRLSAPYTLTVTLPAPAPAPTPVPAPAPTPAPAPAPAPSGTYKFSLVFAPDTDPRVQSAAQAAAAHWESIITRSVGSRTVTLAAQECGNTQAYSQPTQDMVIFIGTVTMDGPGGVLARSGPCLVSGATPMPIAAQLVFDAADLEGLASQLPSIAAHEFGHALGLGSLWKLRGLLQGAGTTDPRYLGQSALQEYAALGGTLGTIPVENSGGKGTADGHWREKTFGNELMTGYLNAGSNPLSRMSIGALQDLGYMVNYAAADAYSTKTMNTLSMDAHVEEHFERPDIKTVP